MKICDVTFQKDRRQYSREGKSTTLIGRVRECVASRPKREGMGKQRPERRECAAVGCCGGWTDRRDDVRISRILYIVSTLALDLRRQKSPLGLCVLHLGCTRMADSYPAMTLPPKRQGN